MGQVALAQAPYGDVRAPFEVPYALSGVDAHRGGGG
jgi:hypothetical protein